MSKILLVEDDPFIVEIYLKKFSSAGFEVDNATTGKEALRRVVEKAYDLILLDLVLPEMSGMDFLREYRGKPAEYRHQTKVVVFSNLNSPSDREQATMAGADGFISKTDFTPTEVVGEVGRFLGKSGEKTSQPRVTEEYTVNSPEATVLASNTVKTVKQNEKKILLIEDEEVFVEMFGERLSNEGYAVVNESNGQKGLDRALGGGFDLIITDAMLPGLDGREIVNKLRENDATKSLPVIFLSASLHLDELETLEKSGTVNRAILKTKVTPSELVQIVNDCLS